MSVILAEPPQTPIASPVPPAERRQGWADPGPRTNSGTTATDAKLTVEQAARELASRHLPPASALRATPFVPSLALFAGPGGHAQVDGHAQFLLHKEGAHVLRAVLFVADPLVMALTVSGDEDEERGGGQWTLVPRGPSATARADALRLLRAMRAPGVLAVAADEGELPFGPLGIGGDVDAWIEHEWRLFEDLATLEEWTGETIEVPEHVDDQTATEIAQAALWVRTQTVPARMGERVTFRARGEVDPSLANELRVVDDQPLTLGDRMLTLGKTVLRIPITVDEVGAPDEAGLVDVVARTPAQRVELQLLPPAGRRLPAVRTQQPEAHRHVDDQAEPPGLAELGLEPIASAQAPLGEVAAAATGAPPATASSVDDLLDDLRGP